MQAKEPTVMATWLLTLLDQLRLQGVAPQVLASAARLPALSQGAPTRQLQQIHLRRLWHQAARCCPDPILGLKVGAAQPLQALNVVALLVAHSGSLRLALRNATQYQALVGTSGHWRGEYSPEGSLQVLYDERPCSVPMHPQHVHSVIAACVELLRRCVPSGQRPLWVALPGGGPQAAMERHFGCPVRTHAPQGGFCYDERALDLPWPAADPSLLRMALARADALLAAQGQSHELLDQVTSVIQAQGYAQASCASVAQALGHSTRTLQRRLEALGTGFRTVLEAARMDEATQGLLEPATPLAQLAWRLGYGEPSALSNAVRRHFGLSPSALRQELLRQAARAAVPPQPIQPPQPAAQPPLKYTRRSARSAPAR